MRKNHTEIVVLLDKSASMASIARPTVEGFNRFLSEQKAAPGTANITLWQFATTSSQTYQGLDIQQAPPLVLSSGYDYGWRSNYSRRTFGYSQSEGTSYTPDGRSTALNDSFADLIKETGRRLAALPVSQRPEKVLFVVVTDGQENASHRFTKADVNAMVRHQEEVYSWEFVYLGANQDAVEEAVSYGLKATNSLTYAANAAGASAAFASVSKNAIRMRAGGSVAFDASDVEEQAKAGVSQVTPTPVSKSTSRRTSAQTFDPSHPNWRKRGPGGRFRSA